MPTASKDWNEASIRKSYRLLSRALWRTQRLPGTRANQRDEKPAGLRVTLGKGRPYKLRCDEHEQCGLGWVSGWVELSGLSSVFLSGVGDWWAG